MLTVEPVSMTEKTITMTETLQRYTKILLRVDVDIHLGSSVDIHQFIIPVYPKFMVGKTGVIDLDIAKAGGAGGLALRADQADFTATSTSFGVSLLQLQDGASLSSGFRIVEAQGERF